MSRADVYNDTVDLIENPPEGLKIQQIQPVQSLSCSRLGGTDIELTRDYLLGIEIRNNGLPKLTGKIESKDYNHRGKSEGDVAGANLETFPSASTMNFSKFQRISPVCPSESVALFNSVYKGICESLFTSIFAIIGNVTEYLKMQIHKSPELCLALDPRIDYKGRLPLDAHCLQVLQAGIMPGQAASACHIYDNDFFICYLVQ